MALNKIYPASPDSLIKSGKYSEAALARIAHVNNVIDQLTEIATEINTITPVSYTAIPDTFPTLAASRTVVNQLKSEIDFNTTLICNKLNALINALK